MYLKIFNREIFLADQEPPIHEFIYFIPCFMEYHGYGLATLTKLEFYVRVQDRFTLAVDCAHSLLANAGSVKVLHNIRFGLRLFPALRHFKIQWQSDYADNPAFIAFLTRSLSTSSSSSGLWHRGPGDWSYLVRCQGKR